MAVNQKRKKEHQAEEHLRMNGELFRPHSETGRKLLTFPSSSKFSFDSALFSFLRVSAFFLPNPMTKLFPTCGKQIVYHRHFSSLAHSEVCSVFLVNTGRPGMKVTSMRVQGDPSISLSRAGTSPVTETSSVPVTSGATTWWGCVDFDLEGWVAPTHLNPFP